MSMANVDMVADTQTGKDDLKGCLFLIQPTWLTGLKS